MSRANPTWGAPWIVGELRKVGMDVAKVTVEKYRVRLRKPPSPTPRTLLKNYVRDPVSVDFFVVPTVTYTILFVLVILAHERRRIVHFHVTEHPTLEWTAQHVVEAFPWDEAPRIALFARRITGDCEMPKGCHGGKQAVVFGGLTYTNIIARTSAIMARGSGGEIVSLVSLRIALQPG
jgi:hypothetical protein